jgi:hypothetical protein
MQPKKNEQTKKKQQEREVQQIEEELHTRILIVMDQQWQETTNDIAK